MASPGLSRSHEAKDMMAGVKHYVRLVSMNITCLKTMLKLGALVSERCSLPTAPPFGTVPA